jgi:hypothetical protein
MIATAATISTTVKAATSEVRMDANLDRPAYLRNLNGKGSLPVRCSEKWGCQVTTARTRIDRSMADALDVMEELVRMGDTERLGHYLALFDAVLAGQPQLPKLDAVYAADCADAEEELAQANYRRNPTKDTARDWLRALGRESRTNEPVMAALRLKWEL